MSKAMSRRIVLWLALSCASGAACADALTVPVLQRLLQASPRSSVAFEELRESPWLSAPIASRGTFLSTTAALEKRLDSPRKETWRLLPDRIEWERAGGAERKQVTFTQAPALASLAGLMRRVVAGDIAALERDFRIELSGDERVWRAHLQPRGTEAARHLEAVELQGTGGRLQVIIVVERQGERTTTRLAP